VQSVPKDLVGVPWRVAFALQRDGWYLRGGIIWAKPNPLPESVRDRPVRAHETCLLFSREQSYFTYFYDTEAVSEPCASGPSDLRKMREQLPRLGGKHKHLVDPLARVSAATKIGRQRAVGDPSGRRQRDVWEIATQAYRGAHFATFPERLVERCILAGTSAAGCCSHCGEPWQRELEVTYINPGNRRTNGPLSRERRHETPGFATRLERQAVTTGWRADCDCGAGRVPALVCDPFAGSGTTLAVAARLGRQSLAPSLPCGAAAGAEPRAP
jgi:hypothetical protein